MANLFLKFANVRKILQTFHTCNRMLFRRSFCSTIESDDKTIPDEMDFDDVGDTETLYPDHIPTSFTQKLLLTLGSAAIAISDPYRDDMVAVLGETTGTIALSRLHQRMKDDPEGQEILRDRPRLNSNTVNLNYLKSLPEESFGHYYLKFLTDNNVSPDTRQPVHFVDDVDLAYVMQRYREVHDLIHTLLGMPTNMLGEVAVKWIEYIQTGLPMCGAGALFGPVRFRTKQRDKYVKTYLPWAIKCGFNAKLLTNVYYEKRWEQPMKSLRQELNIESLTTDL